MGLGLGPNFGPGPGPADPTQPGRDPDFGRGAGPELRARARPLAPLATEAAPEVLRGPVCRNHIYFAFPADPNVGPA